MRHCIALNGSYFNTQRMVTQYVRDAYSSPGGLLSRSESGVLEGVR
jgi:hypothetical protein